MSEINNFDQSSTGVNIEFNIYYDDALSRDYFDGSVKHQSSNMIKL